MKPLLTAGALLLLFSCNDEKAPLVKSAEATEKKPVAKEITNPVVKTGIEGFYTGYFVAVNYDETKQVFDNKITLAIDSVNGNTIFGHSVVAGNERPFTGSYTRSDTAWKIEAREPGDNKYDGSFRFSIHPDKKTIKGAWESNDPKMTVTARSYELERKSFTYDPSLKLSEDLEGAMISGSYNEASEKAEAITKDALRINASTTLLKSKDVENMYKADLEVMRNAIYARHGYSFKNIRMRDLFDHLVEWYMPVTLDVTAQLTDIEKKNIELIKRYEAHATKYYDVFGR